MAEFAWSGQGGRVDRGLRANDAPSNFILTLDGQRGRVGGLMSHVPERAGDALGSRIGVLSLQAFGDRSAVSKVSCSSRPELCGLPAD